MTIEDFIKICSNGRFWKWMNKTSLIPYPRVQDKKAFLRDIAKNIKSRTYYPSPPKEYLTINKSHGVIRIIPVLQMEDLCVYYYCVRKLEKFIALNYVSGTFGGFGLSGTLRSVEEKDFSKFIDSHEVFDFEEKSFVFKMDSDYSELSGLNAKAWKAEWADFTKKIYFKSADYKKGYVAELDIANFYDSIQLEHLEYKLRKNISHKQNENIYLLLHFLRFWNRHINFYRQQGAGIPQDLFGECSRVLANFYLQSYDRIISKFCISNDGQFFRYADDQVIFARTKGSLEQMIAKASSLLMREGLNFNQKKVKIMTVDEFKEYYSFENFLHLAPTKKSPVPDKKVIDEQIVYYLANYSRLRKNGSSLLKRILNILSEIRRRPKSFRSLKKHLISKEFLLHTPLQHHEMQRIYNLLTKIEKEKMHKIILESIDNCLYSDRLYQIKEFFADIEKPVRPVKTKITAVKKFYQFEPNANY
jgi:hypothetical protein